MALRPDGRLTSDSELTSSALDHAADELDQEWSDLTLVVGLVLNHKARTLAQGRPGLNVLTLPEALWRHSEGWALMVSAGQGLAWALPRPKTALVLNDN